MKSLLLDRTIWDLCLDAAGNIAVASEPYAVAQDVASAIRTFSGDCWYNTGLGIPYFSDILGQSTPLQMVKGYFVDAAKSVTGVADAVCYLANLTDRNLTGQVVITDTYGNTTAVGVG